MESRGTGFSSSWGLSEEKIEPKGRLSQGQAGKRRYDSQLWPKLPAVRGPEETYRANKVTDNEDLEVKKKK